MKRGIGWTRVDTFLDLSDSTCRRYSALAFVTLSAVLILGVSVAYSIPTPSSGSPTILSLSSWKHSTIDSDGTVGQDVSMALDSKGKVHLSYSDGGNDDLKYATNANGSWVTETLDSPGMVGSSTSIAVDSNEKIHISYLDWTNGDLKYATDSSGSWVCYTLDSDENVGLYTSIAVDSTDSIHISYFDYTYGDLKYATNANGSWEYFTLDGLGDVGYDTSIAVDSNDKVHISYGDWTYNDLKYATNTNGPWVYYTVDSAWDVGFDSSIAVDSNDAVHISYHDETNARLKYATNAGGSWNTYWVDNTEDIGLATSMAIDSNDKVHIAYRDYTHFTDGDLRYATNSGGSWTFRMLYSEGDVGYDTAIAVAPSGLVHIAFSDYTNDDLRYTYGTEMSLAEMSLTVSAAPTPDPSSWTVQFVANVSGGLEPYNFVWEFGDGASDHNQSPLHTYTETGTYHARIVVTDEMLTTRSQDITVKVSEEGATTVIGEDELPWELLSIGAASVLVFVAILIVVGRRRARTKAEIAARLRALEAPEAVPTLPTERQTAAVEGGSGQARPMVVRVEDRLLQLKSMKEKGEITEEEYEKRVSELLKKW